MKDVDRCLPFCLMRCDLLQRRTASWSQRVKTDNGSHASVVQLLRANRLRDAGESAHLRPSRYTRKTNGKAERFVQTALARMGLCPCLRSFNDRRARRAAAPAASIHRHRRHGGLKGNTPISRRGLNRGSTCRNSTSSLCSEHRFLRKPDPLFSGSCSMRSCFCISASDTSKLA